MKIIKALSLFIVTFALSACGSGSLDDNSPADENAAKQIRTFADLEGKRIAVKTGTTYDALVNKTIKNPRVQYHEEMANMFLSLDNGSADALAYDKPIVEQWTKGKSGYFILKETLCDDFYGMIMKKGSPLKAEIDSALKILSDNGMLEEFYDKWSNETDSTSRIPETWEGKNGKLVVAIESNFIPFSIYKNGRLAGSEVDVMLSVGKILDKKIEFSVMNFSGILPSVVSGKVDLGVSGISITEERKKMVDFSIPYFTNRGVIVVKDASSAGASPNSKQGVFESLKGSIHRTFIHEERWKLVAGGLWVTIYISVLSGIFGILIGFAICMVRRSRRRAFATSSACFIRCIQGTPVLVLLMILYYVVFGKTGLSGELVAIIAFSINFGVYASEIIRSGMDSVDMGQLEASAALGYSPRQTFFKILLPQAAQHFIPVLKGEFISMVKMTSVVGYVAVMDLTKISDIIRSRTMEAFFPLIATAVFYFIIASVMTTALSYCERRVDPKSRPRNIKGVN